MSRPLAGLLVAVLALGAASCRTSPSEERFRQWQRGALVQRELRGYHVVRSANRGNVGYLKVYDVTEAGGPAYPWKYVYDANWKELGFVDQFGGAYRYHYYSPAEQAQQNEVLRASRMPSDSLDRNVMRMLGIDPATDDVTFPEATRADIVGAPAGTPLAGPGIVPAKPPVESGEPQ